MQLRTQNTSDIVEQEIRRLIISGELRDGARLNEVHLSERLGVSRTPLREGLGRLVAEGIVTVEPKKGFFVARLTKEEFRQLYGIRPLLDPEALRLAGVPPTSQLDKLDRLNDKLTRARDPFKAIDLDDDWHRLLLSGCPNKILLKLIDDMIKRTRRYEYALFSETENIWTAGDEHVQITTALRNEDLRAACALLLQNLTTGSGPILEWLSTRDVKEKTK